MLPAGKPVEMPEFEGNIMMARLHYCGIVRVTETRDDEGIHLHTREAREAAKALLLAKDNEIVTDYIRIQLEDRVRINMPALPPAGRQAKVIARHGVKLENYGVRPVGWVKGKDAERGTEVAAVAGQADRIASLEGQLDKLTSMMTTLLADKAKAELTAPPTDVPPSAPVGSESLPPGAELEEAITLPDASRVSTDEPGDALEYEVTRTFTVNGTKHKRGSKVRLPLEIAEQHFDHLLLVEGR